MALEVLKTKRRVIAREFTRIRAGIFVCNFDELLHGVLGARGFVVEERLVGIGGVRSRRNAALVSLRRRIEGGRRFHSLPIDIKLPAPVAKRHKHGNQHDDERKLPVRDYGFGAVLDGFLDFVLLQLFARNMFGHTNSPDWFGICNRNTRA